MEEKTWNVAPRSYREEAEARLRNRALPAEPIDITEAQRVIHELQVHQIELELQNEELQRVQKELESARQQYYDLYNFAPVGYVTLDTTSRIQTVNDTASLLLGERGDKSRLIGKPFTSFLLPQDQDAFYLFVQGTLKSGSKRSVTLQVVSAYRDPLFIQIEGIRRETPEGEGALFCAFWDITERVKMEEELRQSIQVKELLLRELHHRVKNNLQLINSLIYLQKSTSSEPSVQLALEKLQGRIQSIHLMYEMLQKSDELSKVNAAWYCKSLTEKVLQNLTSHPERIRVTFDLDEVWMETDKVVSLGLILNEILLNALKYAFPNGREGSLILRLKPLSDRRVELQVQNDGPDFSDETLAGQRDSMGFQIIQGLLQKHRGTLELKNDAGPAYYIRIPNP